MAMYRTPIIANPRKDGSTMYTFSSALEDIGLNINERNNKVCLSHYVLLDLPSIIISDDETENSINVRNLFPETLSEQYNTFLNNLSNETIDESGNKSNGWFSVALDNYMMNMETALRNQGTYDHSVAKTVTERCFWKFLQKTGAITFDTDTTDDDELYYHEDWSSSEGIDKTVIKGYGSITSSSQSSNSYNINNETYIMVPSSYGQMKYVLKRTNDNNYTESETYVGTTSNCHLENHDSDTETTYPLALADVIDESTGTVSYDTTKADDMIPDLEFVFSTSDIRKQLFDDCEEATISYDNIAIDTDKVLASKYKFNTVLVYYSIYDSTGNIIATNLFGILLVNGQEEVTAQKEYKVEELTKIQSTTGSFGSSYFFRLNIQTASIYDAENDTLIDYSTAESSTLTDFNDVVSSLKTTVDILTQNAKVIANQYTVNQSIKEMAAQAITKVTELEQNINDILTGVNEKTLIKVYPYVYRGVNKPTDHHFYIGVRSDIDLSASGISLYYAKLSTVKPNHKLYKKRAWHSIPKLPYVDGSPVALISPVLKSTTPSFTQNGISYYEVIVEGFSTFCEFINQTYSEYETGYTNKLEDGTILKFNVGKIMQKGINGICILKDGVAVSDFAQFKVRYPQDVKHYTITF